MPTAPTLNDRRLWRVAEILAEHSILVEWPECDGETNNDDWHPDRYLLVEKNRYSTPGHYVTSHRTPEAAGSYHFGQEYSSDYTIVTLVDLDDGTQWEVDEVFLAWPAGGRRSYSSIVLLEHGIDVDREPMIRQAVLRDLRLVDALEQRAGRMVFPADPLDRAFTVADPLRQLFESARSTILSWHALDQAQRLDQASDG